MAPLPPSRTNDSHARKISSSKQDPHGKSDSPRIICSVGLRAPGLNFVFTRVVNHCVTVVGLQGARRPARTEGQSLLNRLRPSLNVETEIALGKKTNPVQYLRAIRLTCPKGACTSELGFA